MPSALATTLDNQLQVWVTYEIENFTVTPFIGKYKCLECDIHMIFTHMTKVAVIPFLEEILMHEEIFNFTHLSNIKTMNYQDDHCIGKSYNFLIAF